MSIGNERRPDGSDDDNALDAIFEKHFPAKEGKDREGDSGVRLTLNYKRISDQVFGTLAETRLYLEELAQQEENSWLKEQIEVPIVDESVHCLVPIPKIAAISLATASKMAFIWKSLKREEDAVTERIKIADTLKREMSNIQSADELVRRSQEWSGVLEALASDQLETGGAHVFQIANGLDPAVLNVASDFTVKEKHDPVEQIGAISRGIIDRMHVLCGREREQIMREIEKWDAWTKQIVPARPEHATFMKNIYKEVMVKPAHLTGLVSLTPKIKNSALEIVENTGGFLHEPDDESFQEMMEYGVAAIVDHFAYYGVLTDTQKIKQHLQEMLGFDPTKHYQSIKDLPKKGTKGWRVRWLNDRRALEMFKHIDRVALSVEVAVKEKQDHAGAIARRDSGVAASLKHYVYDRVPQDFILTRHFEIVEVNGVAVPSALNRGSGLFIQALGGKHIGSAEETFDLAVNPLQGAPYTIKLKVLWHFNLAEREESIRIIERKGRNK